MRIFNRKKVLDAPKRRNHTDSLDVIDNSQFEYSNSFRRNRTITGTTSDRLNIANTKLQHLESDRLNAHNLNNQRRKVLLLFLIVALAALSIWILVSNLAGGVSIAVFDSSISKTIEKRKYETMLQNYLNINPASRLSFFLNQDDLTNYASSKMTEIKKVSLSGMDSIGVMKYGFVFRKPIASWQLGDERYYVDSEGIAFKTNYYTQPQLQIIDNSGINVSKSNNFVSKRFLSFAGRAVSLIKGYGYTVTELSIPVNTTRQLEMLVYEGGYRIKLSIDRPAGEQVEDAATAIGYFKNRGIVPPYVDVRVSGRAFYK